MRLALRQSPTAWTGQMVRWERAATADERDAAEVWSGSSYRGLAPGGCGGWSSLPSQSSARSYHDHNTVSPSPCRSGGNIHPPTASGLRYPFNRLLRLYKKSSNWHLRSAPPPKFVLPAISTCCGHVKRTTHAEPDCHGHRMSARLGCDARRRLTAANVR